MPAVPGPGLPPGRLPLPVPHGLLHPGAEPAAEQAAGPGRPVLRHLLLRLVQRRRLAGVRPQPPGEHGDDPRDLRQLRPHLRPPQREPAVHRPSGTGEDLPLRLHRPGGQRPGLLRGLRHRRPRVPPVREREIRPGEPLRGGPGPGDQPLPQLRPADHGRPGHGDAHQLRPGRLLPHRQRPAPVPAEDGPLHQLDRGGDWPAVRPGRPLPGGGGVPGPSLLR